MARIRTIKPEFPHSESMGNISRDARLTFIMLWTLADDSGRLRGNSRMLASLLFPYDDDAPLLIGDWLAELEREGCIERYTIGETSYCQIRKWLSHQKIDKPSASKIPPPPEDSRGLANSRESSSLDQGSKEGIKGRDQGDGSGAERERNLDADDSVSSLDAHAISFNSAAAKLLDRWQTLPEGTRGVVRVAALGASGIGILAFVSPKDKEALTTFLPHKLEQALMACDAIENGAIEWDRAAMTLRQFPDAIDSLVADACKEFKPRKQADYKTAQAHSMMSDLEEILSSGISQQSQQKAISHG